VGRSYRLLDGLSSTDFEHRRNMLSSESKRDCGGSGEAIDYWTDFQAPILSIEVRLRSSRLRESSEDVGAAEGAARIPANAAWTKRLRGSLAAMRLCNRCPAAAPAVKAGGGFREDAGQDGGRNLGCEQGVDTRRPRCNGQPVYAPSGPTVVWSLAGLRGTFLLGRNGDISTWA
jgi:hypothetical protein